MYYNCTRETHKLLNPPLLNPPLWTPECWNNRRWNKQSWNSKRRNNTYPRAAAALRRGPIKYFIDSYNEVLMIISITINNPNFINN